MVAFTETSSGPVWDDRPDSFLIHIGCIQKENAYKQKSKDGLLLVLFGQEGTHMLLSEIFEEFFLAPDHFSKAQNKVAGEKKILKLDEFPAG